MVMLFWFRHYAWDYRVLRTFARHYSTGDVIPEKLVESMNSARNMFAATELQRQVDIRLKNHETRKSCSYHYKMPFIMNHLFHLLIYWLTSVESWW